MTDDDRKVIHLRPAEADLGAESRGYLPRIPWKIVGPALAAALSLFLFLWIKDLREMARLRGKIMTIETVQLGPVRTHFEKVRNNIEAWTIAEAARTPNRVVNEHLNVDALQKSPGLYLRVNANDAKNREALEKAALQMRPDAITRCLGVAPASARGLYELGGFLLPDWLKQVHDAPSIIRLRVLDDELNRRMHRDLPSIATMLEAEWFLLAIERGDNHRDAPVDMYLWNLRTGAQLLAVRTQAHGLLIPARANYAGQPDSPYLATQVLTGATNDCSIASQVRAATGHDATTTTIRADELRVEEPDLVPPPVEAPAPNSAPQTKIPSIAIEPAKKQ